MKNRTIGGKRVTEQLSFIKSIAFSQKNNAFERRL